MFSFEASAGRSLAACRSSGFIKSDAINADIHDRLKASLGEARYRKLKASQSMGLQKIYIHSQALGGTTEKKGIINHDAVVVELIELHDGAVHRIRAEKVMADKEAEPTGIIIDYVWGAFHFDKNQVKEFDCFGSAIRLKEVMSVLKRTPPNYDLIEANCWQYAATATRDLIKKLVDTAIGDDARAQLETLLERAQQHLDHTKKVIRSSIAKGIAATSLTTVAIVGVSTAIAVGNMLLGDNEPSKIEEEEEEEEEASK